MKKSCVYPEEREVMSEENTLNQESSYFKGIYNPNYHSFF